ncbi:ferritin [Desertihabitans brevis]|uniref:Ferritin n=1 Tax=Desertihabitans brevis TaxID=2268447 RepID=A0A367YTE4_9ACTN|nr:ferritin [Desertihabitans brevis]RCK69165.1 ferritin [Desertihabitans brevis]
MTTSRFVEQLNEQIGYEFSASQQYVACAVHYAAQTMPQLAGFFYRQAMEEREHAMMMVQFLLDTGAPVSIPGVATPRTTFADVTEPVALALEQEKRVTEQIHALTRTAREEQDLAAEQFMQWFIKEQVEEVSTMGALLAVTTRATDVDTVEEWVAREHSGEHHDPTAPPVAGE